MEQMLFNAAITFTAVITGWVLKVIWQAVSELKNDVKDTNQQMFIDFVRRDDFKEAIKELKESMRLQHLQIETVLVRLCEKIDAKEDK